MRRQLRALSPIVSVILLILIAVAASVLIYTWMSGMATQNPAEEPGLKEKIKIEAVKTTYNSTLGKYNVTIYVRNIGQVSTTIDSAYVLYALNGTVVAANTSANVNLAPGEIGEVMIYNVDLANNVMYIAKVITKRGIEAVASFTVAK